MTIGERIKKVRKDAKGLNEKGFTLEQFGEKIGLKKSAISVIENDSQFPTDRTINDICREFNVSEEWLRYGNGDPYVSKTRDEEIADFLAQLNSNPPDSIRLRVVSALARLDDEGWEVLARLAEDIVNGER